MNKQERLIAEILKYIGEDPNREGLLETPARVVKSWSELYSGYKQNPDNVFKCFEKIDADDNGIISLKKINFYSMCEHHMLPFTGEVDIGYIPNGKVVGISKLARVVDIFSKRLQVQERMTYQIAESIFKGVKPKGVIVVTRGQHFCTTARGIKKSHTIMTTTATKGVFNDMEKKLEFLQT
ncbi:MAG: GTP cyclohydrolase 1 [Candidatus Magnetoglobus multicellularis str. Araruama]|uniref:GTP cyclohydrolase 1 n=1 Tax=Candidatus Magnetoglobus multicellularis str. Araruama TaxID=890399 RepID=A0A1V1PDS2_9BACT|nr:MAG: GTP cyclohydrolase 1 [Candidatus Magnetoglobus multicellularis str. Araruama]